ncbi:MAG: GNAT family N-acetyltransferase [Pseudomonadota bacterium]
MTDPSIEISEATTEAQRAACLALRADVFIAEQGVSEADERDGRDGEARHLLALVDGAPLGTLRLRVVGDAAKLERVCVAEAARGTGLGVALTKAALDLARTLPGLSRAKLSAQASVVDFYTRLGFVAYGEEYMDAGILHRDMMRDL